MNSHQRRLTILSIKKWLLRSQNQMQGAFQQNHICYFSVIWACRPAARRVRRRVESIYSRRSEEPKTVCQRKPTAPLALSSTERLHKKPFACLPIALWPSGPVQQRIFHQAEQELTALPGLRYSSGHRKGRLKILSIDIIGRIRALAKKAPTRKDWLDVNETIQEVIALAH